MTRTLALMFAACIALGAGPVRAAQPRNAIGMPVVDASGARIGEVMDTRTAPGGEVTHLVVAFEKEWHEAEGWLAVPIASFSARADSFVAGFEADDIRPATAKSAAAAAPTPPPSNARLADRDVRMSLLARAPVRDSRGERLGTVADLVVDMVRRRIVRALVAPTPAAIPIACRLGSGGVVIAADEFVVPGEAANLAALAGCVPDEGLRGEEILASQMLRTPLVNVRGERVGAFREIVVRSKDASLHYVVGDFGATWLRDGLVATLPLRPLRMTEHGPAMVAYFEDLHRMLVFDERRLPDVWSPLFARGVDKYLEAR